MSVMQNPLKSALRKRIKDTIKTLSKENKQLQSNEIAKKVISSEMLKYSTRISIYLSTQDEVDTTRILEEMFNQGKGVFVPTYCGDSMEMVELRGMDDYEKLSLTKWNIKQPNIEECRKNALENGGLDLFLIPGVAFTKNGGRLGHGKGYYDKYLTRHFKMFPERCGTDGSLTDKLAAKKTILLGLAFKEQIVDRRTLPLDPHDFLLDSIITSD